MFNKSMSFELKRDGIICLNVNSGWVKTDLGGQKAECTPEESVNVIIQNVLENASLETSGSFVNYDGTLHPW